jgi:dCTP deaminase
MILNDTEIQKLAERFDMIKPFSDRLVKVDQNGLKLISYGLSSFGYDIRLSPNDFYVFVGGGEVDLIDPKNFDSNCLQKAELHTDETGEYFIIPGNSYALGVSLEYLQIPDNVLGICTGKSTYARVAQTAAITPLEPGWKGYITLEFANHSPIATKIYANEGVVQVCFHEGDRPFDTYSDRAGKYQDQAQKVVFAKV